MLRSLIWEFTRRSHQTFVASILACTFLPWLFNRLFLNLPADQFDSRTYYPAYLVVPLFLLITCVFQAQDGVRKRLYRLPLSTRFITAWLYLTPIIVVVLGHWFMLLAVRGLFGAEWPWLRSALYATLVIAFLKTCYLRLIVGRPRQLFLIVGLACLFLWGLKQIYVPDFRREPVQLHNAFTLIELLAISLSLVATVIVGHWTICKERVGEASPRNAATFFTRLDQDGLRNSPQEMSFAGPESALRWLYWRDHRPAMLATVILSCLVALLQFIASGSGEQNVVEGAIAMLIVLSGTSGLVLGMTTGLAIRRPGDKQTQIMSTFLATKPVSDRTIWRCRRVNLLRSTVTCWLISLVIVSIVPLIVLGSVIPLFTTTPAGGATWRAEMESLSSATALHAIFVLSPLIAWGFASLVASCTYFGRDKVYQTGLLTTLGVGFVYLFAQPLLPAQITAALPAINATVLVMLAALIIIGSMVAFTIAMRRQLISWRSPVIAIATIIFAAFIILVSVESAADGPKLAWVLSTSLTTLAVTGLAVGPIGLALNRHR